MKTKPFNLEEAKAGKPFARADATDRFPTQRVFIGVRPDDRIVYCAHDCLGWITHTIGSRELVMIVEPEKIKGLLVISNAGGPYLWFDSESNRAYLNSRDAALKGYKLLKEFEMEYEEK